MPLERLESPPSLPGLFAKALAGVAIPGRSGELPERRLALREQQIDLERVADYCRVCGFSLGQELPATYPHLLGFPLELELMGARSFPFPILGVVHVANRIEQQSAIPVDARADVVVWAERLRPHRRGRQFDLVTELALAGEPVWREHSTYLRPGAGGAEAPGGSELPGDPATRPEGTSERSEPSGEVAAVWKVPGGIGRRYGGVSGDRNPIHIHPLTAKPFGFGGAIAHGMWTMARCLAALDARLPDAVTTEVEFRKPLRIPGRVELRVAAADGGFDFALAPGGGGKPHLIGSAGPV